MFEEYINRLKELLRSELKRAGHFKSGSLYDSIEFKFDDTTHSVNVELGANDYIQYLDDGQFIDNFFNSIEVENIISDMMYEYTKEKLIKNIK